MCLCVLERERKREEEREKERTGEKEKGRQKEKEVERTGGRRPPARNKNCLRGGAPTTWNTDNTSPRAAYNTNRSSPPSTASVRHAGQARRQYWSWGKRGPRTRNVSLSHSKWSTDGWQTVGEGEKQVNVLKLKLPHEYKIKN